MKNTIKNFAFAAVLFFAAGTAALCAQTVSDYQACRCRQSSPGITDQDNVCCNALNQGKNPNSTYTAAYCCNGLYGGYGANDGDGRCCTSAEMSAGKRWVASRKACLTACPSTCAGGTRNTSVNYSEDGSCCTAASSSVWQRTNNTFTSDLGAVYIETKSVGSNPTSTAAITAATNACNALQGGSCDVLFNNFKATNNVCDGTTRTTNAACSPKGYSCNFMITHYWGPSSSAQLCDDKSTSCTSCNYNSGDRMWDCYNGYYVGQFSSGTMYYMYRCICYVVYDTVSCS